MWITISAVQGRRKIPADLFGIPITALFALPTVRGIMPGAPFFGCILDYSGIILNLVVLVICVRSSFLLGGSILIQNAECGSIIERHCPRIEDLLYARTPNDPPSNGTPPGASRVHTSKHSKHENYRRFGFERTQVGQGEGLIALLHDSRLHLICLLIHTIHSIWAILLHLYIGVLFSQVCV